MPLSGRIDVCLTNAQGRDILLYEVAPGQSCVQSTLGLMGGEDYSAEARTETEVEMVFLPKTLFLDLIDRSPLFRAMVLSTFAGRLQSMMHLLEKVAFLRVEARLAAALLTQADADGVVHETQSDLATRIGTTREVVARQLAGWGRAGLIESGRGRITLRDRGALDSRANIDG